MTVADLAKQIDQSPATATVLHERPALIQELTFWPPQPYSALRPAEPLQQILFSFYRRCALRMSDDLRPTSATKGLNGDDMVRIVSAKYGTGNQT